MREEQRKVLAKVEAHILRQVTSPEAIAELRALGPKGIDWNPRVRSALSVFLPKLVEIAPTLIEECMKTFNSPIALSGYLNNRVFDNAFIRVSEASAKEAQGYKALLDKCRDLAKKSCGTIPILESQQISAEVKRFLLSDQGLNGLIRENGGSIYPDLLLNEFDYSFLPFQSRNTPISGPCLKNKAAPIPSNVPDGCEIKTNQSSRIKVDAHGAHPGLHLGITWGFVANKASISDIWLAYIRIKDYSISDGRVDVTTKKRSFGHDPFISVLRGDK